ncbi:MAG: hypothetical protein IJE42_03730 [Bacteroidaceae bacterium]|nr:hypothetical protein [Bacteroidaceae bacterium]
MENNNKIETTNPEDKKYIDLINTGNFLLAVKEYKEDHNCGLKEAKDYIDRLRGIEPGSQKEGCCIKIISIPFIVFVLLTGAIIIVLEKLKEFINKLKGY